MKNSSYTVWVGRQPGVYRTWAEAEAQVKGFKGSRFKGFVTHKQAEEALTKPWEDFYNKPAPKEEVAAEVTEGYIKDQLAEEEHEYQPSCSGDDEIPF